ncbi:MAG TPA: excinuclease ABC subunit UvrA [Candidatus Corynebacterium avicola]|uniref:UvrABC system protein A n=1 Tax=Candidatus Corynebacterium avicola TaxID=2838527 RepID=A0A9D1RNK7_9CORY|nr:excinuclease ABC subunit UvrA [Candidatus Corynebacterium avicola]
MSTSPQFQQISVTGARTNNLENIDVTIPKYRFTVVAGVSGSGKSSLVFDTIAAEAERAAAAGYPSFVRNRLPHHPPADVDHIGGLTFATVIDQRRFTGNVRSTVATATDVAGALRILFSRFGVPSAGFSPEYNPNDPAGMCLSCEGLGEQRIIDEELLIDPQKTLREGAIRFPTFGPGSYHHKRFMDSGLADPDVPWSQLPESTRDTLLHAEGLRLEHPGPGYPAHGVFDGIVPRLRHRYLSSVPSRLSTAEREGLEKFVQPRTCPECRGARVKEAARRSLIMGRSIADWMATPVNELSEVLAEASSELGSSAEPVLEAIEDAVKSLVTVGLGYLTLGRPSPSLSGGEAQRVKIVRQLGSPLTDVTYIFDEPSAGLHAHDVGRLVRLLCALRDLGNTVLVVEHNPEVIRAADHLVELGPGAGNDGGEVVRTGSPTGAADGAEPIPPTLSITSAEREPTGWFAVENARSNNLRNVTTSIPSGVLTVVTGVAGSGKSSLVTGDFSAQNPDFTVISQLPLRGGRRSTPLTVLGVSDEVRSVFAAAGRSRGLGPPWFSRNSKGACAGCKGRGVIVTDLAYLDDIERPCEACGGSGFNDEALSVRVSGRSIAEITDMRPTELAQLLGKSAARRLGCMDRVGLGYLSVGRTLDTLSGGERQRLLLAQHLAEAEADASATLKIILDEPTSGLHSADVARLLALFDELVDDGATVVIIEHSVQVAAHADHVIDIGPGAGLDGGRVVFSGTPHELVSSGTLTGEHLRRALR